MSLPRQPPKKAPASPIGTGVRWTDADLFYEQLLDAHATLTAEQSADLNARLILVLAHEVGDAQVLSRCLRIAVEAGQPAND